MGDQGPATRQIDDWLDGLPSARRTWAITCMTSAAEGGIACLDVDSPTCSALLREGIATVAHLKRYAATTDLRTIPGIGPARLARIRGAIATYESEAR